MYLPRKLRILRRDLVRTVKLGLANYASWVPEAYPDFICIGAPRASTTWLHQMLRRDQRLFLPKAKELHFFDEQPEGEMDNDAQVSWRRSFYFDVSKRSHLRWYSMQFQKGIGKIKGEITPTYAVLSRKGVESIVNINPQVKIIYVIRNPIDRAWSGLRNTISNQKGRNHALFRDQAWLLRTIMHPQVLKHGNYRHVIETWSSVVRPENMLYVFYDDIVSDPRLELTKVYSFLGLTAASPMAEDNSARVNAAPVLGMPKAIRTQLTEYYRDQICYLESRFKRNLQHWKASDA